MIYILGVLLYWPGRTFSKYIPEAQNIEEAVLVAMQKLSSINTGQRLTQAMEELENLSAAAQHREKTEQEITS